MKKRVHFILILLLAVLLFANYANAQTWQQIAGRQRFTVGVGLPVRDSSFYSAASDTAFLYINPNDTTGLYWKYKGYHRKIGTGGGGGGSVTSVFGRTGDINAASGDYSSFYPLLSGSYNNPSWINQLAWSKITGAPAFITNIPTDSSVSINNRIVQVQSNLDTTRNGIRADLNSKQGALTLTTTGSSGAATLVGNTLNIPQYSGGGGGGSQSLQQVTDIDSTTTNVVFVGSDNISRNDTVQAAPYMNFVTGTANYGSQQNLFALNFDASMRIRQRGQIKAIRIYLDSVPVRLTSFYITIWRKTSGAAFNIIDSVNILSQLSNGVNFINLPSNWFVRDGDYLGWGYTSTGAGSNFLTTGNLGGGIGIYYKLDATHPVTGTEWIGSANSGLAYLPIEVYMDAPDAVFIGDSKTVGYNNSIGAYTENTTTTVRGQSFPDIVSDSLNWKIQNMGIGNQTSTQIAARFQKDVVDKQPMYAVIEMGVNDVTINASVTTVINNYNTVLALCTTNNIKPVILYILPWTNGTNAQNTRVDSINAELTTLATTYNAILVDARPIVGKFRSGGAVGNYWDIQTSPDYDDDGVHFTDAGYLAIANEVQRVIKEAGTIAFVNPNPKGAAFRVGSRTKGLGLPVWNEKLKNDIDSSSSTSVGVMGYVEDIENNQNEGVYVKTTQGMKRLAEQNYGTYAQRIALTNVPAGTRFFQYDFLIGDYVYNGTSWIQNLTMPIINQRMLNSGFNTAPTGSTLTNASGGDFNNISNVSSWDMNHPVLFQTGITNGGGSWLYTGGSFASFFAQTNKVAWQRARIRNNLSTSTERFIARFGVGSATAGNSNTGFTGFQYCDSINSGKFQLISNNGSTTVNTDITASVNTTYDFVIVFSPTDTKFYINGAYAGAIASSTVLSFRGIVTSVYKTVTGSNGGGIILDRHILYEY